MNLYLDLDDVVFDTTKYLEDLLGWKQGTKGSVYDRFVKDNDFSTMSSMLEYTKIPLIISRSQIDSIKNMFNIIFCTEYYSDLELQRKQEIVKSIFNLSSIIGVDRNKNRKYNLDLSNGVLVDDTLEILQKCNAMYKIHVTVGSNFNRDLDIVTVRNFKDLYKELERIKGKRV